mmetsp:Transcript_3344/g.7894  ORF Transcript_3344/g.7894 Transcript_3344/m.7894 type:complete len:358 (-) Transcript_3344:944-2017(-)
MGKPAFDSTVSSGRSLSESKKKTRWLLGLPPIFSSSSSFRSPTVIFGSIASLTLLLSGSSTSTIGAAVKTSPDEGTWLSSTRFSSGSVRRRSLMGIPSNFQAFLLISLILSSLAGSNGTCTASPDGAMTVTADGDVGCFGFEVVFFFVGGGRVARGVDPTGTAPSGDVSTVSSGVVDDGTCLGFVVDFFLTADAFVVGLTLEVGGVGFDTGAASSRKKRVSRCFTPYVVRSVSLSFISLSSKYKRCFLTGTLIRFLTIVLIVVRISLGSTWSKIRWSTSRPAGWTYMSIPLSRSITLLCRTLNCARGFPSSSFQFLCVNRCFVTGVPSLFSTSGLKSSTNSSWSTSNVYFLPFRVRT